MHMLRKIARLLGLSARKSKRRADSYYQTQSTMRRVLSRPGKIDMSSLANETLLKIITDETAAVRIEAAVRELCRRLKLDLPVNPKKADTERARQLINSHFECKQTSDAPTKSVRTTTRGQKEKAASLSENLLARKGEAASPWIGPGE